MARSRHSRRAQPTQAPTQPTGGVVPIPGIPSRWGDYLARVDREQSCDYARREALAALAKKTGRSTVVYATAFHNREKAQIVGHRMGIELSDVSDFREMTRDLPDGALDLILHTPGGSADAAASIVRLLRSRFDDIRVIVPLAAKSAGTMLAMAANRVSMLHAAELGPIDPQMPLGQRLVPAKAIEDQFEQAAKDIAAEPKRIPAWMPLLSPLGPSMLQECAKALALSEDLVTGWLATGMFKGDADALDHATRVANFLSDYRAHKSHGRPIHVEDLTKYDVKVSYLADEDRELERLVTDVWITIDLTFLKSAAFKYLENSKLQGLYHQAQIIAQVSPRTGN